MAGYTPLFDSLTTGTLYGRWPDIGLWAVILSLPDKRGIVDVTPEYLAGVTGLPVDDVIACMDRFCKPDPRSRSGAEGGARLTLIDPSRSWGWRIVNHGLYRERARKMAYDADRTASGKDAERKRISREVPTRPAKSREVPLSDADADTESNKDKNPPTPQGGGGLHEQIIAVYHEVLPDLPAVREWPERRRRKLDARIAERVKAGKKADQVDYWRSLFTSVQASDFLCGRKGDWRCPGLEWLLEPKNFTKVIEGAYRNHEGMNGHAR